MTTLLAVLATVFTLNVFAQENPTEKAQPIVAEGKLLYRSEMASWHGTDLFLENFKDRAKIGGYFSYTQAETSTCIFFSKGDVPRVIGTVSFDSTYNIQSAKVDLTERDFSEEEKELHMIRKIALAEINADTLFKTYKNTSLNLIPLINKNEKKVYVLTGPQQQGVVMIGNDYLLTFDKENKLTSKKKLHNNLIPIYFGGKEEEGKQIEGAMHTHLPETGDFITATDICTLMLYEKFAKWNQHNVVSEKYLNIWNCLTDELLVVPMQAIEKIDKDQKKSRRKKKGHGAQE